VFLGELLNVVFRTKGEEKRKKVTKKVNKEEA